MTREALEDLEALGDLGGRGTIRVKFDCREGLLVEGIFLVVYRIKRV